MQKFLYLIAFFGFCLNVSAQSEMDVVKLSGHNESIYFKQKFTRHESRKEISVERSITVLVENFTGKAGQKLHFDQNGFHSFHPANEFYVLKSLYSESADEIDEYTVHEKHLYFIAVMENSVVADFNFSEIARVDDDFVLSFSPGLHDYSTYFTFHYHIDRKGILGIGRKHVVSGELYIPSDSDELKISFTAPKAPSKKHRLKVALKVDKIFQVVSSGTDFKANQKTLEFIPVD